MFLKPQLFKNTARILFTLTTLCSVTITTTIAKETIDTKKWDAFEDGRYPPSATKAPMAITPNAVRQDRLIQAIEQTPATIILKNSPHNVMTDDSKGQPIVRIPVFVSPGTNGFTPKIAVNLTTIDQTRQWVEGIDIISECVSAELCLNETLLKRGLSPNNKHILYPIDDPLLQVFETEDGLEMLDASGKRSFFSKIIDEKNNFKVWKVVFSQDAFGNFITFDYDKITGKIVSLHYGKRDVEPQNLKSVRFYYGGPDKSEILITSYVGEVKVRSYLLKRNRNGYPVEVTECGYDKVTKNGLNVPVCTKPLSLSWDQTADEVKAIKFGAGGEIRFAYAVQDGKSALKSQTDLSYGKVIRKVHFSYSKQFKNHNKSELFQSVLKHEEGTSFVEETVYEKGDLKNKIKSQSLYSGGISNSGKLLLKKRLSGKTFTYTKLVGSPVPSFVLSKVEEETTQGEAYSISTTTRSHDDLGRMIISENEAGSISYKYIGNTAPEEFNNLVAEERIYNAKKDQELVKEWGYEFSKGLLVWSKYQERQKGKAYSDRTRVQELDIYGNIIKVSDSEGVTEFRFDPLYATFPEVIKRQQGDDTDHASFRHDPKTGAVLSQDLRGEVTSDFEIDPFGRVLRIVSNYNATDSFATTENTDWRLTDAGYVEEVSAVMVKPLKSHAETVSARKVYDAFGNILIDYIPSKKTSATSADTEVTYAYDVSGWTKTTFDPTAGTDIQIFDRSGRLIEQRKPGYEPIGYAYDDLGRLEQQTQGHDVTRFAYDDQNRLVKKSLSDDQIYEFSYANETSKQIQEVKLPSGIKLEYSYDELGREIQKSVFLPLSDGKHYQFDTAFEYADGRLNSIGYPDGSILNYTYDEGSLAEIRWREKIDVTTHSTNNLIARYEHKLAAEGGYVREKRLGNLLTEKITWDPNGVLSAISLHRPSANRNTIAKLDYQINPGTSLIEAEKRSQLIDQNRVEDLRRYTYTDSGRLVLGNQSSSPQISNVQTEYDVTGNIRQKIVGNDKSSYFYDAENNLTKSVRVGEKREIVTRYVYDHMGSRIKKETIDGDTTYYINPFYSFTILADGRMQETKHVWDNERRIASYSNEVLDRELAAIPLPLQNAGEGPVFSKVKGLLNSIPAADVLKISVSVIGILAFLLLLKTVVLSGVRGGITAAILSSFITLSVAPTAQAALNETAQEATFLSKTRFYHADIRGSVYAVTNENGESVESHTYSTSGALTDKGQHATETAVFAGHEYDPETGLYYMGARYYDPIIGQFLTADPARTRKNPYEYANGNPISFIDPDGRAGEEVQLSRWQRFKNWTGIANWRCCGAASRQVIPEEWGGPPTEEEKAEFDEYHRSQSVQGWSRFGGYLQSLLIAPILAYAFPSSKVVDGVEVVPGFGVDLLSSAIRVTIFSAFGKAYTAVEALRWEETMERGVTPRDGYVMLAKRMAYKV
ncbi:MAG: RHS repeat-associated core domain-containing protein, partial [Sneathiella sp.]|nr:RHS repeat-associated core domain-containing protein [Sneathiella sp.]